MKRKQDDKELQGTSGKRQPQVSCDYCRRKKLKCDRGVPCSSCSVRGLACGGTATAPARKLEGSRESVPRYINEPGVLERLNRLENAMFGAGTPATKESNETSTSISTQVDLQSRASRRPATDSEHPPEAKALAPTHTVSSDQDSIHYALTGTSLSNTPNQPQPIPKRWPHTFELHINMLTLEESLLLLDDFVDNPLHLLPLIHETTVRLTVTQLYDNFARPGAPSPHPAHAALVLSVAATCASFYHIGAKTAYSFDSEDDATAAMLAWLNSALNLLDQSQRSLSYCLEDVQARVILSYLLSNTEGCSGRFRSLHSTCVHAARELGLHLVDRPRSQQVDNETTREIKRRLWWYIVSNDWMLGFIGGPLDGAYSIQPRHMNVRQIRNINNEDLDTQDEDFEQPYDFPTDTSFLIQRARLAEVCRIALDTRAPGAPDEDLVDIDSAIHLDGLFSKLLRELPRFFQLGNQASADVPRCVGLQRDTIVTAIHSRWSRVHRCHLLVKQRDPRAQPLRERCLSSARTAVFVATRMLDPSGSSYGKMNSSSVARRTGIVVGHLFTGCTMLAMIANPAGGNDDLATSTELQEELRHAYQMLTAAAKNSPVAATMVRELTGVLRQYSLQGVADGGQEQNTFHPFRLTQASSPAPMNSVTGGMGGEGGPTLDEAVLGEAGPDQNDLWTELLGTMNSTDGWDGLFTGLDPYCGTA